MTPDICPLSKKIFIEFLDDTFTGCLLFLPLNVLISHLGPVMISLITCYFMCQVEVFFQYGEGQLQLCLILSGVHHV